MKDVASTSAPEQFHPGFNKFDYRSIVEMAAKVNKLGQYRGCASTPARYRPRSAKSPICHRTQQPSQLTRLHCGKRTANNPLPDEAHLRAE
jgi:hypothetical protein